MFRDYNYNPNQSQFIYWLIEIDYGRPFTDTKHITVGILNLFLLLFIIFSVAESRFFYFKRFFHTFCYKRQL